MKLHEGRYQAFQVRTQLQRLFREKFDPATLAPLPTPVEEIGPPEVYLKRKSDSCPYWWRLRTDYMRPKVLEAWQAVKRGTIRFEHAVRDLVNLVAKTHYDVENATHRVTREREKITLAAQRAKDASVLLGADSIQVRARFDVAHEGGLARTSELYSLRAIDLLEAAWGWSRQATPHRYFDIPDHTRIGKRAKECASMLDAIGKVRRRGQDQRQAVRIYLEAVQDADPDPMARVAKEHHALCSQIDPACPEWPENEPGGISQNEWLESEHIGISQNELLKLSTGATRGKRQRRIIELIRGLLSLKLLQRHGKGRAARLILGPGPNGKRCPD